MLAMIPQRNKEGEERKGVMSCFFQPYFVYAILFSLREAGMLLALE